MRKLLRSKSAITQSRKAGLFTSLYHRDNGVCLTEFSYAKVLASSLSLRPLEKSRASFNGVKLTNYETSVLMSMLLTKYMRGKLLLTRSDLHDYQNKAIGFIKDKGKCALFLDMGLGKTISTLTAISDYFDDFAVSRVLVIAPLRVANTVWKQEAKNWKHTKHLDIGICTGPAGNRRTVLNRTHDVTVINRENIAWLVDNNKWQWDMVVIDESSSFKSAKSKRFKALRKVVKYIKKTVLLTGTPSPNGQMDLWSQMYLIDQGDRLCKTITNFRNLYFQQAGYMGYAYELREDSADRINNRIKDVCLSMSSEDYLELPDRVVLVERVVLPLAATEQYKALEREFLIVLEEGTVQAVSAGVLAGKLLQYANGAVYDEEGVPQIVHNAKIDAIKEIVEDNPTENLLVAYNYKHDLSRLQLAFPNAVTLSKSGDELETWNRGEIKMLLAHPASAGHGLNAQHGGSVIVWFGLNWSLELYQQFNARLHRQGQEKPVRIMHIVTEGTIDEQVLGAIGSKAKTQSDLLEFIKKANN